MNLYKSLHVRKLKKAVVG